MAILDSLEDVGVPWKATGTDQYTIWNTDNNGNYVSSIGVVSGNSPILQAFENSFHQDLNGDGRISPPATVLDGHLGNQTLTAAGGPTVLVGGPRDTLNGGAGADMLIVPDSDTLMVEVKISPQDIDQLYLGQVATLRFTAFNMRTTPEIKGTVSFISADITQDQRTGVGYYVARVMLSPSEVERLGEVKLIPGMPVVAFIKTSERTMLSYLVKPLRDQVERAFREK